MSRSRALRKLQNPTRTKASTLSASAMSGCARASRTTVPAVRRGPRARWAPGAPPQHTRASKSLPLRASPMQTVSPGRPGTAGTARTSCDVAGCGRSPAPPSTAVGSRHDALSGNRRKKPGQTHLQCAEALRQRVSTARKTAAQSTFPQVRTILPGGARWGGWDSNLNGWPISPAASPSNRTYVSDSIPLCPLRPRLARRGEAIASPIFEFHSEPAAFRSRRQCLAPKRTPHTAHRTPDCLRTVGPAPPVATHSSPSPGLGPRPYTAPFRQHMSPNVAPAPNGS